MTTSHRPQLEARSGAKSVAYVPTGTQHARLLPGHTKLKFRKSKKDDDAISQQSVRTSTSPPGKEQEEAQENNEVEEDEEEEDEKEEEGEEEDESDCDDDQEELLKELNKIRQERMISRGADQPIIKVEPEDSLNAPSLPTPERNWRSTTAFGRNRVSKSSSSKKKNTVGYQNDITKSDYHQDFLRRYVK